MLDHAGDVMREALDQGGTSFDALYVNVNGASGYFDRSLARLRPGGAPLPEVRHAHPARAVHEPVVVLVPALPAAPPRAPGSGAADPEPRLRLA